MSEVEHLRLAILEIRDELENLIDGGEERQGSDAQLSAIIRLCDAALAKKAA